MRSRLKHFLFIAAYLAVISEAFSNAISSASSSSSSSSIGQRIQEATDTTQLLEVAADLWLPTDDNLPPHFQTQRVHHEKRQRWSAQLLGKLGGIALAATDDTARHTFWQQDSKNNDALERAVLAAAMPFDADRPEKEGRYIREALVGVHNMLGYTTTATTATTTSVVTLSPALAQGVRQLVQRADKLADRLPLPHVMELRCACRGILARCNNIAHDDDDDRSDSLVNHMNARVASLPFDIAPCMLDWSEIFPNQQDAVDCLQKEIPFHFDTIVTRTGAAVMERRGTAWVAEQGVGALAYSGKLMEPQPISSAVRSIMRLVEARLEDDNHAISNGPYFDCALCNHYPDGESACKFHTDPEHGSHWERFTCVVAAGSPRRFAFRPVPGHSVWTEWENSDYTSATNMKKHDEQEANNAPAVITLFPGDVVQMWGTCNDDFHHAVYPGPPPPANAETRQPMGRISLVLKRAIARHGGMRGHSLAGQGRRARRTKSREEIVSPGLPQVSMRPKKRRHTSKGQRGRD